MAEAQATPVSQLPSNSLDMNNDTQDNEIVNEILNEIDHQNMKGNPAMTNNSDIFQRNVDQQINSNNRMMPEPTPEQIMSMNQQQMEEHTPSEPPPTQMLQQQTQAISEEQMSGNKSSDSFKIINYLKDTLTVIVLVFLFSFPILNILLSKIPKAMVNGSPSMIGNAVKAILAGAIFFVVSKFV